MFFNTRTKNTELKKANLQGVSLSVLHYSLHKSKVASIFADEMRLGEAR